MMRKWRWIFILLIAFAASSCGSGRKVTRGSEGTYRTAEPSAEESILAEMAATVVDVADHKSWEKKLMNEALSWRGTPYKSGGHSKKGTDCSGFVMEVYRNAFGIALPRSSSQQADECKKISKKDLKLGDLVFFHGTKKNGINHVGIYVGNGNMIHASSSKGVVVTPVESPYFADRLVCCGRLPAIEAMMRKRGKRK